MLYLSCLLVLRIASPVIMPATLLMDDPDCGYLEMQPRKIPYLRNWWEGTRSSFVPEHTIGEK